MPDGRGNSRFRIGGGQSGRALGHAGRQRVVVVGDLLDQRVALVVDRNPIFLSAFA